MSRSLKWTQLSFQVIRTMGYMLITWYVSFFAMHTFTLTVQDMTKFTDRDDDGYVSISGELRRWVKGLQPALGIVPPLIVPALNTDSKPSLYTIILVAL